MGLTFKSRSVNAVTGEMQGLIVASVPNANTSTAISPVSQTASGDVSVNRLETATASQVVGANVVIGFQAQADAVTISGNSVYIGEQAARPATGANNTVVGPGGAAT